MNDGPEPDDRSPTRSARRRAREFALQGLYQWLVAQTDVAMIEAQIVVLPEFERSDTDLFRSILRGVILEAATLHKTIVPLIDRPLIQLSPVEHAAILIGAWEFFEHIEEEDIGAVLENIKLHLKDEKSVCRRSLRFLLICQICDICGCAAQPNTWPRRNPPCPTRRECRLRG